MVFDKSFVESVAILAGCNFSHCFLSYDDSAKKFVVAGVENGGGENRRITVVFESVNDALAALCMSKTNEVLLDSRGMSNVV